jgi:hypothetical protein
MLAKDRAGHHDQSICALLHDRQERRLNIVSGLHLCWNETEVQGPSRPFDLSKLRAGGREARIPEDAHAFGIRNGRDQQFQPFRGEIAHLNAYPSEIPARSRQRGNKAGTNRVAGPGKYNRDRLGCGLSRLRRRCPDGEDNVRLKTDELGGEIRKDLGCFLRVAPLEGDVLPLGPAEVSQSLRERLEGLRPQQGTLVRQDAHSRDLRGLLRVGR